MSYWFQFGYQLALVSISAVFMGWIWKFVPLQPSASFFSWFLCAFLMAVSYGGVTVLFNVLRYAGHARNGAPCAGDGGNPVAVAEKKLNRDAEVLPGIGNGDAASFMLNLR